MPAGASSSICGKCRSRARRSWSEDPYGDFGGDGEGFFD
jgi:hypothetical protein